MTRRNVLEGAMQKSRPEVGRWQALQDGSGACVDCLGLGQQRTGRGRPPRCEVHHQDYRTWYQRKWRYEQRHGKGAYPHPFEPVYLLPTTESVTVAASEVETIDHAVTTINSKVISGIQNAMLRATAADHKKLAALNEELAQIAEELEGVADRLRRAKR
jgi:hypothetical protein